MLVGQPKLLKEVNRNIVKDMIFEYGPMTKPEISKKSNLSLPTINKIVDSLEEDGIIRQDGITGSSSGKKAKLYTANENAGNIIILFYLEEKFKACLVNVIGTKIYEEVSEINNESRDSALTSVYEIVDRLIELSEAEIKAIGLGVPGVVKSDKRIANISSIPGWTDLNLEKVLGEHYHIPVFVENDVKLATVGYYHTYLQEKYQDMVYLYIGKGIGSGVIINGDLHKGFTSFSGEFGYLAPFYEEVQTDHTQGGGWLEEKLKHFLTAKENILSDEYLHYIAVSMVNYIAILNPEIIVVQGKGFHEDTIKTIESDLRRYIPKESLPQIVINDDEECAVNGLINFCLRGLTTIKQLVLVKDI